MCVSGFSLGYYLNRSDLNDTLFITNPFDAKESPLFKTGDLVTRMQNGNLHYLHRKDREVEKAIVIKYENDQHAFIASYLTVKNIQGLYSLGKNNLIHKLRDVLLKNLPEHLLPATFDILEKIPLNLRDKIDYNALPAPNISKRVVTTPYEAPNNPVAMYLAALWQD